MIKSGYRKPRKLTKYERNKFIDACFRTGMWLLAVLTVVLCIIYKDVIRL